MLKTSQLILFIVLGAIFWFAAAMFVRILGPDVLRADNPLLIAIYIVSIPILAGSVVLSAIISRTPLGEMLLPVVVMTTTALLLDGLAISWGTGLYGEDPRHVMHGAALILWGAGVGQVAAWVLARRADARAAN
jgi:hypothetical protein